MWPTAPKQKLDLSIPAGTGFTTVLFIHGGSLTGGDKSDDDYRGVCAPFMAAGIACANVNYRLAPAHAWPAQAEDVAASVAWIRTRWPSSGTALAPRSPTLSLCLPGFSALRFIRAREDYWQT
jgi:acetyl esterase/lipase